MIKTVILNLNMIETVIIEYKCDKIRNNYGFRHKN